MSRISVLGGSHTQPASSVGFRVRISDFLKPLAKNTTNHEACVSLPECLDCSHFLGLDHFGSNIRKLLANPRRK